MANTGQNQSGGVQAFSKNKSKGAGRSFGSAMIQMSGAACATIAVLTAITPAPHGSITYIAGLLERLGLDKGPMFLFGATIMVIGYTLMRLDRAPVNTADDEERRALTEQIASDVDGLSAIMASLQGEISAVRTEVAEARQEAKKNDETTHSSPGAASDPMFRLAASLDQLGARIDKRMDSARQEMLSAVKDVATRIDATESQPEPAIGMEQLGEFSSDIASMRAEIARLADGMQRSTAEAPTEEPESAPAAADLPRELSEDAPTGPVEEPRNDGEPQFGMASEEPAGPLPSTSADSSTPDRVSMTLVTPESPSLGFPEEPPTAPLPSEGLELIDEMEDDTARAADMTPPLFPEIDGSESSDRFGDLAG